MPPADRLRAIRLQMIADASGFGKLLKNKKLKGTYGDLQTEGQLTRPPKGFDADSPHIEYIRLKNFIVWKEQALKKMLSDALEKELLTSFQAAYPLINWLRQIKTPIAE